MISNPFHDIHLQNSSREHAMVVYVINLIFAFFLFFIISFAMLKRQWIWNSLYKEAVTFWDTIQFFTTNKIGQRFVTV